MDIEVQWLAGAQRVQVNGEGWFYDNGVSLLARAILRMNQRRSYDLSYYSNGVSTLEKLLRREVFMSNTARAKDFRQRVEKRAYELYESGSGASAEENWLHAETEILASDGAPFHTEWAVPKIKVATV